MVKLSKLFLFLLLPGIIIAQTNDSIPSYNNLTDSIETQTNINFLMFGMSYTNNEIKYKSLDNNIKMPRYAVDLSYFSKTGLWASINYTNYFEATTSTYETGLQLGYQHTFLKFIDFDFNYGYHNFKGDNAFKGISYNHSLNGSLSFNSKYISFITDGYSLHGLSDNYFINLGIAFNVDIDGLLFQNDFFLFNPNIIASFGTDDWIYENFTPLQRWGRKNFLARHGYSTGGFEYQSFGLNIPVIYSLNNISLSISWFYNLPSDKLRAINWENQSGVLISLIYSPSL